MDWRPKKVFNDFPRARAKSFGRGVVKKSCLIRKDARTARIDDLPFERCNGDVRDLDSLQSGMTGCSAAINLAYSTRWALLNSPRQEDTAVSGTRNILEAATRAGVGRVVQVSSIAAIGATRRPRIQDETKVFDLKGYERFRYAHYKHRAEQLCQQAVARGLDVVIVNPAEVYGPDDTDLVTAGNILDMVSRNPVVVTHGGTCIAHVDDVAAGIRLALERGRNGERYILGGENLSLRQMAALCLEILGLRRRILTVPSAVLEATVTIARILRQRPPFEPDLVPYASKYWFMDGEKARLELGAHFRDARPTLTSCINWLRATGRISLATTQEGSTDTARKA